MKNGINILFTCFWIVWEATTLRNFFICSNNHFAIIIYEESFEGKKSEHFIDEMFIYIRKKSS